MSYAEGMKQAMRIHDKFEREEDAATYWAQGAPLIPVEDLAYTGGGGQRQAARLYRGDRSGPAPVLLYIHGGGWVGGSIALNEPAVRSLVAESGWSVLSVSYRLAPHDPYPAGLQDCRAALEWLDLNGPAFGLDSSRIAIGGASAGANLAVATSLAEPVRPLVGMILFYGVFGASLDTPSYKTYADGHGLTRARMAALFEQYDPENRRFHDPLIAPLLADDLSALSPALLVAAQMDVLADDSRAFAARMQARGGRAVLLEVEGVTHGFINRGRLVPAARTALTRAARFLISLENKS
ncbi:MAG TPA: alpha/beta hydrolase [Devosiaceae bacterium]